MRAHCKVQVGRGTCLRPRPSVDHSSPVLSAAIGISSGVDSLPIFATGETRKWICDLMHMKPRDCTAFLSKVSVCTTPLISLMLLPTAMQYMKISWKTDGGNSRCWLKLHSTYFFQRELSYSYLLYCPKWNFCKFAIHFRPRYFWLHFCQSCFFSDITAAPVLAMGKMPQVMPLPFPPLHWIQLSIVLSVLCSHSSARPSIHLLVNPSIYQSIYLSVYLSKLMFQQCGTRLSMVFIDQWVQKYSLLLQTCLSWQV